MYTVSATEEIRHPGSLIARFLRTEFPVLNDLAVDFQRRLHGAKTLSPDAPSPDHPWSLVGTAIDYRLRFLFEKLPVTRLQAFRSVQYSGRASEDTALDDRVRYSYGPEGRVSVYMPKVSAALFTALREFLRRVRPHRRVLSRDDEAWLCRYCAALALVDFKLVASLRRGKHPLEALSAGSDLDDLFGLIPRDAVLDICRLSRRFQETTGRDSFAFPVEFDPHVGVGHIGASPDVRVGDCLLDLKTTIRPRLERVWLDQVLLYLLAVGNRGEIKHVGFHLVRQARSVTWPIEDLTTRAAGGVKVDLDRLSQEFFAVAARSSFLPPKERWSAAT